MTALQWYKCYALAGDGGTHERTEMYAQRTGRESLGVVGANGGLLGCSTS